MPSIGVFSTSNYLEVAAAPVTTWPFAFAAWVYPTSSPAAVQNIFTIGNTSNDQRFGLFLNASLVPAINRTDGSGATNTTAAAGSFSTGAWQLISANVTADNDCRIYGSGCTAATGTASRSPATPTKLSFGVRATTSPANALTLGYLGPCMLWNTTLSNTEHSNLQSGVDPLTIQPASLIGLWGLFDQADGLRDLRGSAHLSVVGTLSTQSTDPPIGPWRPLPFRRFGQVLIPPGRLPGIRRI